MASDAEKQQNLFSQSHMVHITPLVIHGLRGRLTDIHPHRSDFKKPGARKNVIDGKKHFIECMQKIGENYSNKVQVNDSGHNQGTI